MPTSPLIPCAQPSCPELVPGGRCQQHRVQRRAAYDGAGGSAASRGYDQTWRNFVQAYRHGLGLDPAEPGFAAKLAARNRCAACWAGGSTAGGAAWLWSSTTHRADSRRRAFGSWAMCSRCATRVT